MAAGLGFKTFTTGEVLTAADTNGYLMQGVLVFASAAARDAAITSPQEGQCCYLKDTDAVLTYSGAAWVGFDDSNAIQNSIVDAKGDLIAASAADTPARLAVGSNGETLVANSAASTGLSYQANFAAGKNKIINGDFYINQRAFTTSTVAGTYGFDRFRQSNSGGTATQSAQTFTAGAAPVAGYEGKNYVRMVTASQSAAGDYAGIVQSIEDVRSFAGQTIVVSFWAQASTGTPNIGVGTGQNFGSGGSATVITSPAVQAITTSWVRYSFSVAIPSISGKTIGTSSLLDIGVWTSIGTTLSGLGYPAVGVQNVTINIWGVQVEAGSGATAFQTATGTLQGELAACQRYYFVKVTAGTQPATFGMASYISSNDLRGTFGFPVEMRVTPTLVATSGTGYYKTEMDADLFNSVTLNWTTKTEAGWYNSGDGASGTKGQASMVGSNNALSSIALSAEL